MHFICNMQTWRHFCKRNQLATLKHENFILRIYFGGDVPASRRIMNILINNIFFFLNGKNMQTWWHICKIKPLASLTHDNCILRIYFLYFGMFQHRAKWWSILINYNFFKLKNLQTWGHICKIKPLASSKHENCIHRIFLVFWNVPASRSWDISENLVLMVELT